MNAGEHIGEPANLEAERELLGGLLLGDARCWYEVRDLLVPGDFFLGHHASVWRAVEAVFASGEAWSPVAVEEKLAKDARLVSLPGGAGFLVELAAAGAATPARIKAAAETIRELSVLRRIRLATAELGARAAGRVSSVEIASEARRIFADIEQSGSPRGPVSMAEGMLGVLEEIDQRCQGRREIGVRTGFERFDERFGGLKPGRLIVVAARPGIGKTSWAQTVCAEAASRKVPSLIFSLEMSFGEMAERVVSQAARVPAIAISNGQLDRDQRAAITRATAEVRKLPLWIDDRVLSMAQVGATSRSWRARRSKGLALIVIDYLGLLRSSRRFETRALEVGHWAREAKELAKELACPVVLVSQLNRGNDKEQRPPRLSDLRDSGEIEQHADMVLFPHREPPLDQSGPATLIIAKNRGGPTGIYEMHWLGEYMTFTDAPPQLPPDSWSEN